MRVKTVVDEDFTNYREPAMLIGTISCGGKCCVEAGLPLSVCQNDGWRANAPITMDDKQLCSRYLANPITKAVVFGGLDGGYLKDAESRRDAVRQTARIGNRKGRP